MYYPAEKAQQLLLAFYLDRHRVRRKSAEIEAEIGRNWRENGAISGGRKTDFHAAASLEIGSGNLLIGLNLVRAEIGKSGNRGRQG